MCTNLIVNFPITFSDGCGVPTWTAVGVVAGGPGQLAGQGVPGVEQRPRHHHVVKYAHQRRARHHAPAYS